MTPGGEAALASSKLHTSCLQGSPDFTRLAEETLKRCQAIAGYTETPGWITRTFLSDPMRDCHAAFSHWMREAGMQVSLDAVGNLHGLYGSGRHARRLMIGSHLDTVPCAGAYDGVLGVCIALAVVEGLEGRELPFDVEVIGFSEEEGVRFRVPFLGSLAAVGRLDERLLGLSDAGGCSVAEAIRRFGLDPAHMRDAYLDERVFGFLEFHIEQGPVLEDAEESIAVVEAIAGQSRLELVFRGSANHAGTTPMDLRRDALVGAAEWITGVEQYARLIEGLVATVGKLEALPGAGNVIPGEVRASLDVRHRSDETRLSAVEALCGLADRIAWRRGLSCGFEERLNQKAVPMDGQLIGLLERAMKGTGETPRRLVSGAGHDAMIMAEKVPSAMVFIRSIGGISHHPDEAVRRQDVEKAIHLGIAALAEFTV